MGGRALLTRSVLNRLVGNTFQHVQSRHIHIHRGICLPGKSAPRAVTLIPGDGIGPILTDAVEQVISAMCAPIYFEKYDDVRGDMERVPEEVLDSIRKNKVCLKGPLMIGSGSGTGVTSSSPLNMQLRKELDLFASVVNCANLPDNYYLHTNVVIRENTEPGEECLQVMKLRYERIAKYAFEYAYLNKLEHLMAVHKASDMKHADGLFLESCRKLETKYDTINYCDKIVEDYLSTPGLFHVVVTPYLYGDLVATTAASIHGDTTVMIEANVGADHAIFEQCASAGNKKLLPEKDVNPNPVGLLLSTAMLLRHLHFPSFADILEIAVKCAIRSGYCATEEFGGDSTTQDVVDQVIWVLDHSGASRFSSGRSYESDY